jgi:hypothetical protein
VKSIQGTKNLDWRYLVEVDRPKSLPEPGYRWCGHGSTVTNDGPRNNNTVVFIVRKQAGLSFVTTTR